MLRPSTAPRWKSATSTLPRASAAPAALARKRGGPATAASAQAPPVNSARRVSIPCLPSKVASAQAAQRGPDARRRPKTAREAYSLYVERVVEGANEADGPLFSSLLPPLEFWGAKHQRGELGHVGVRWPAVIGGPAAAPPRAPPGRKDG